MKHIIIGIISFLVCFTIFFSLMLFPFFKYEATEKAVLKNEQSIAYNRQQNKESINIKISIEDCPVAFLLRILPKNQKLSISCSYELLSDKSNEKTTKFNNFKYSKQITFSLSGFENTVNFLGGVEIETPYGLPSPSKNDIIIAKDERVFVYGASLGALLCKEPYPTQERMDYYCYALGEVCLKFLKEGSLEAYKFLNKNCSTDISYTNYYDNYKSLKESIKYTDVDN
ncbi:MAG: hypothetical protein J6C29_02855 [Clostridia bacterium]|nr:hypothetical protein [Clostridia bacterium]